MLLSSTNGTAPLPASTTHTPLPAAAAAAPAKVQASATVRSKDPAATDVEKAVKTLNDFTAMVAQDVRFSMDEESGRTIVKVVDTATQEVLRQFPSAEALSIARSIDKMQGLLIREKA